MEKREPYCTVGGNANWYSHYGEEYEDSDKNLERWYWWTYLQSSHGDTNIDNRLIDTAGGGEEGEGGRYGERNVETYITICKIDSQWEFAIWLREFKPGLGNNVEG